MAVPTRHAPPHTDRGMRSRSPDVERRLADANGSPCFGEKSEIESAVCGPLLSDTDDKGEKDEKPVAALEAEADVANEGDSGEVFVDVSEPFEPCRPCAGR